APLRSYFGRVPSPRDLGLAYVQLAAKYRDATYVEKAWPLLRTASQSNDPPLLNAIAAILTAEGQIDKAIAAYRLSLAQDPAQPETLQRLAALLGRTPEAQQLRRKATQLLP
ncbi:MAG: tetratricopeptide repeat protein, partial [Bryobacterales bacterium]|nr:tetratricopeptide repeat protein [Bryobacterales bacterium]